MSKLFAMCALGASMILCGCESMHKKSTTQSSDTMKMSADGKTCAKSECCKK